MGYRKLLKEYISHVEAIVGVDLIDIAALTNALSKRDIGELRSMSAELKRESFMHGLPANHNHTVRRMLDEGTLNFQQLKLLTGIDPAAHSGDDGLSDERFERFVKMLLQEAEAEADDNSD